MKLTVVLEGFDAKENVLFAWCFLCGCGDQDSGPHACAADPLPIDPPSDHVEFKSAQ